MVLPMNGENRSVVLGLDGVPHSLIKGLSEDGVMPNFARLVEQGTFKKMDSSIPAISSTSWGTIITGQNPGEHGVYGFTDVIEGTYTLSFSNFLSFKEPAFWQNNGGSYVILNVPSTYPAQELNGAHVSGFVSPNLEKAVYPQSLLEKLNEIGYKIDVDAEKGHKSERLLFKELQEAMEARIKAYRYLWEEYNWNTFTMVFTGTDRLEHFLWDAYEDSSHESHEEFLRFFERIDEVIGEIDDRLNEDDSLIMLSDHGMERVKANVNLNAFLEDEGYLKLSEDEEKKKYNRIEEGTKAFALEHGRIYLNREGKYPNGTVKENEEEDLIAELKETFENLERDGRKVIRKTWEKEEIYEGSEINSAPDLVLVPNSGYNLRGKLTKNLFEESPFTGMHNREAFLYARNNKARVPKKPSLEDIVPIMNEKG